MADQIYVNSDAHTLWQLKHVRQEGIRWLKENEKSLLFMKFSNLSPVIPSSSAAQFLQRSSSVIGNL